MPIKLLENHYPVPVAPGSNLKCVGMNNPQRNEPHVVNIGPNDGFAGMATTGLSFCVAVMLIETQANGEISRMSMVHLQGGLDINQLVPLKEDLQQGFQEGSNRQLIVMAGTLDTNFEIYLDEDRKAQLVDIFKLGSEDKIVHGANTGHSTACATFEGFAGHVDQLQNVIPPMQNAEVKNVVADNQGYHREFQFMLSEPNEKFSEILKVAQNAINKDSCKPEIKAQMYYLVHRQITALKMGDKSYENKFKEEMQKLPILSKTKKILLGICCVSIIGMIPVTLYYRSQKKQRENLLNEVKEIISKPPKNNKSKL